jgi:hypothetical protein
MISLAILQDIVLTILNKILKYGSDSIFINDHFMYITSELAKLTKHNIYI